MIPSKTTDQAEWTAARLALLEKEKQLTKLRDEVAAERQAMPWMKLDEDYEFAGPDGPVRLSELFGPHSQLIIYHYMFGPEWQEPCKICSLFGDHFDRLVPHLSGRDTAFAAISRTALDKLAATQARFGWSFPWLSSLDSSFNMDFQVSFPDGREGTHNFAPKTHDMEEMPGLSVFAKGEDGSVYHTYSIYSRGLEDFMAIYRFLDVVPKGRDETELPFSMMWVNYRDTY